MDWVHRDGPLTEGTCFVYVPYTLTHSHSVSYTALVTGSLGIELSTISYQFGSVNLTGET